MELRKLLSIILAFVLCFSSLTVFASAEEIEDNSDFLDTPTLPSVEAVEVSVMYRPLKSLVSFAGFGPDYDGTVLKVTYLNGDSETVVLKTNWTGLSDYVAGNFNVYISYFDTMQIKTPGIIKQKIVLHGGKNEVEYEGGCNLNYFYIPSPIDCIYIISSFVRICF